LISVFVPFSVFVLILRGRGGLGLAERICGKIPEFVPTTTGKEKNVEKTLSKFQCKETESSPGVPRNRPDFFDQHQNEHYGKFTFFSKDPLRRRK
jgi:hypothetical protein